MRRDMPCLWYHTFALWYHSKAVHDILNLWYHRPMMSWPISCEICCDIIMIYDIIIMVLSLTRNLWYHVQVSDARISLTYDIILVGPCQWYHSQYHVKSAVMLDGVQGGHWQSRMARPTTMQPLRGQKQNRPLRRADARKTFNQILTNIKRRDPSQRAHDGKRPSQILTSPKQ